jgi:uncharacterized membrane-anchored protein
MSARLSVRSRPVRVAAACGLAGALVVGAVLPQLSARLTGETYRLAVAPLDPIDPFRGAYVTLDYPGLQPADDVAQAGGSVYVPLVPVPDRDLWEGGRPTRRAPASGPYLRCEAGWRLRCGIESLFASQDEALALERQLSSGAVAVVRVDGRGNAAVVDLEAPR